MHKRLIAVILVLAACFGSSGAKHVIAAAPESKMVSKEEQTGKEENDTRLPELTPDGMNLGKTGPEENSLEKNITGKEKWSAYAAQERGAAVNVSTFDEFKRYAEDTANNHTINLKKSINLTEQIDISKSITIHLNGYTIRPKDNHFPLTSAGAARMVFNVKKGAALTVKGSGNISGSSTSLSLQNNLINVKSGGTFHASNVTFSNIKNIQSVIGDGTTTMLFNSGTTVLSGCTIKNCVSNYGYTLFSRAGTMEISNCKIQNNTGGAVGGGSGKIYIHNNTVINENTVPAKHKESNYQGVKSGGVSAQSDCKMYLYGTVTISKNSSDIGGGGLHDVGTVFVGYEPDNTAVSSKITISGNQSGSYGGGIGITNGSMKLSKLAKLEVTGNQCGNGCSGSGIYVGATSSGKDEDIGGSLEALNGAALSVHGNGSVGSGICVGKTSVLKLATDNVKIYGEASNGIISYGNVNINGGSFYSNASSGINSSGKLNINGGSFYDNGGAGIATSGTDGEVFINKVSCTGNSGSGIRNSGVIAVLKDSSCTGNTNYGVVSSGTIHTLCGARIGMSAWDASKNGYIAAMNVSGGLKNSGTITDLDDLVVLAIHSGIVNSGKISSARNLSVITSMQDITGKNASVKNSGIMAVNGLSITGHGYYALSNSGTLSGSLSIDGRYQYTATKTTYEKESTRNFLTGIMNSGMLSLKDSFLTNCSNSTTGNVIYNTGSATLCSTGVYNGARNGISNYGEIVIKDSSVISGNGENGIYCGLPGNDSMFRFSTATVSDTEVCNNGGYGIYSQSILNIGTSDVFGNGKDGIWAAGNFLTISGKVEAYNNKGNGLSNGGTASLNGNVYAFRNGGCGVWNSANGIMKVNDFLISGFQKYISAANYVLAANGSYAVKNEGTMEFAGKSNAINDTRLYGDKKSYAVFGNIGSGRLTLDGNTNLGIMANNSKWGIYNSALAVITSSNQHETSAGCSIEISGNAVTGIENFGKADLYNISVNGAYKIDGTARTVSEKKEIGTLIMQSGGSMTIDGTKTKLSNADEDGVYVAKSGSLTISGGTISDNGNAGIHNEGEVTIPFKSTLKITDNDTGIYNASKGTLIQKDGKITGNTSKTGVAQYGIYKMSQNAKVAEDNYVYLPEGHCITVDDALYTNGLTARIKPEDYFLGRVVVKAEVGKGKNLYASDVQNWDSDRSNHLRFTLYTYGKDTEYTQNVYSALGLGDKINSEVFYSDSGLNGTKTIYSLKDGTALYEKILGQKFGGATELTADVESWKNDIFLTDTYRIAYDDHIYISYDNIRDSQKEEYQVKAWKRYTDSSVNNVETTPSIIEVMNNADLFRVNVNNTNPQIKYWCEDLRVNAEKGGSGKWNDATLKTELKEVSGTFAYWFFDKKEYKTETERQAEYSGRNPNIITKDSIEAVNHVYTVNEAHVLRSAWDLSYDIDYNYQGVDETGQAFYTVKMAEDLHQPLLSDYQFLDYMEMKDCKVPDSQKKLSGGSISYKDTDNSSHTVKDYISSEKDGKLYCALQKADEASTDDSVRHLVDEENEMAQKFGLVEKPVLTDRNMKTGIECFSVFLAWEQNPYVEHDYRNLFGRDKLKLDFLFPIYLQKGMENPNSLFYQQNVYNELHPAA